MKSNFLRSLAVFILLAGDFLFLGNLSKAETTNHLVISEVQVAGASASDEFIEIYNPTETAINIETWSIQYKSATGTTFYKKNFSSGVSIPAHGWFLIAHTSYLGATVPDMSQSTISLAGTGGNIFLVNNQTTLTTTNDPSIIDKVAYGTGDSPENIATPAPSAGQSIERKFGGEFGNGEDTDNNLNDFNLQITPNPQNTASAPKPDLPPPPPPPAPICGNAICEEGESELSCPADCAAPPPPPALPVEPNIGDVVINEFVSDPAEGNEWIELYNKTDNEVNLEGCKLEDGIGTISTLSGTIAANGANKFKVIELSSSKLNNSGDIIKLKKADETILDQVVYGDWDDGNTGDNAPKTSDPNSVARKTDGGDTSNDASDFAATATLTKGLANIITAPQEDAPSGGGTLPPATPSAPPSWPVGSLLINEFVADPDDGGNEWIELFNSTPNTINLSDWTIEDGGETVTKLSGSILSLNFYVIEKPKGILNNSGDIIILKDPSGLIIDDVVYGDWSDGDESDNAPAGEDPNSVARKKDGQDSNNDFIDFIESTPTKGASNIGGQTSGGQNFAEFIDKIIINEVLPNPKGDDTNTEFIELKNIGTKDIDLKDWKIGDASNKKYTIKLSDFSDTKIKASEFFILYRKTTGIALNNTGRETVKIFAPDNSLINSVEYLGPAEEDESWAKEKDEWFWTTTLTPDKENIITKTNKLPTAVISSPEEASIGEEIFFDGSDSYDEDGEIVAYLWDFGDGNATEETSPAHIYNNPGRYKITLTVKDKDGGAGSAEAFIDISSGNDDAAENIPAGGDAPIIINEALPNPEGSDSEEWIELFNAGENDVDLSGWQLDDGEGGSKPYKIPDGIIIGKNDFLVFQKEKIKLALNNTFDSIRLINPMGEIISETNYDEVPEGASWARDDNDNWQWTTALTPGEKNIFEFAEKSAKTSAKKTSSKTKTAQFTKTNLGEVKEYDLGDSVTVEGQIIAPPGLLGSQIFYIASENACPGIQVYMYKKDFPDLKLGDLVEVSGVLSENGGERRIKIKEKTDIKFVETKNPPSPFSIQISDVEEDIEGCLVSASATIIEKDSNNFYLDDNTGELKAYLKAIPKPKLAVNDSIQAIGIISETKTGFRLLPRYEDDLKIILPAKDNTEARIDVPAENKTGQINTFLGIATGILGITTLGLSIKSGLFANWWKKDKSV
jgi:PKD repeat protein